MDPAGGRRRHGVDLIAAIFTANRRTLHGLVVGEVGFGDKPAVFFHLAGNLVGDSPFIEGVRAVLGNQLQAFPQILLHQPIAFF